MSQGFDVLNFLVYDQSKAASENLNNGYDLVEPIDPNLGYGRIWRLKTAQGDTWDVMLYDNDFVYDYITEVGYNTPTECKQHFNLNYNQPLGFPRCPRFITTGLPAPSVSCFTTKVRQFKDSKCVRTFSIGSVRNQLFGPFPIDHGGDVGVCDTYVIQYQWNGSGGTYTDEETYWYGINKGLLRWTHAKLDVNSGVYIIDQTSIHNKLVKSPRPTPLFPTLGLL